MKLTKEHENKINIRLDDLYRDLLLDGITPKKYGSIVQRLHDTVEKAKELAEREWKSNVNVDMNGIIMES